MHLTPEQVALLTSLIWTVITLIVKYLNSRIPKPVAQFVTATKPEEIDDLVVQVSTKRGREQYVKQLVTDAAARNGVQLDTAEADKVVNWLNKVWRSGMKFADQKLGR